MGAVTGDRCATTAHLKKILAESGSELRDPTTDFFTRYHALHHLRSAAERDPALVDGEVIAAVQRQYEDERFARQRQSLFFFRQAAEVLTAVLTHGGDRGQAARALAALRQVMVTSTGSGHRATVEAVSSLPTGIRGPVLSRRPAGEIPRLSWPQLLRLGGLRSLKPPAAIGRSLVTPLARGDRLLVVKLARRDDVPQRLAQELDWMRHLLRRRGEFPASFRLPRPLGPAVADLFRLTSLPAEIPDHIPVHPELTAIGFTAPREYFAYPNTGDSVERPGPAAFRAAMRLNASLLGKLASQGIVHSAPIALFHNRIQVERRRDRGCYEWFRAGRLDRWLASCEYPNLGVAGIRDFEHLISFRGQSRMLYRHIGNHLLSLLLVAGSYFRNREPHLRGLQANGRPVDSRHLFDRELFQSVIEQIFQAYYEGFVGAGLSEGVPVDLSRLAGRLIEELGVDRHMEEILRTADQDQMSVERFEKFLRRRGYPCRKAVKGAADIVLHTGPHLGGFNRQISVPELIEAVGTMSAWCVAGRFWRLKYGPGLSPLSGGCT